MTTQRDPSFPLSTLREAAIYLRRPFTPEAVRFKVQATWPKDSPTGGLVVAYIDARLAVERLNLIVPDRWSDHYEPAPWLGSNMLLCHLTVDGITRTDVGEGQGKGLMSDALKRAAVKFGVGVSLYAIPKMRISVESGQAKPRKGRDGKMTLEMTPRGESDMRGIYRVWLTQHGARAFGEPLDHGDVDDAAGDHEEQTTAPPPETALPAQSDGVATAEQRYLIKAKIRDAALPPVDFANAFLLAAGREPRGFDTQKHAEEWAGRQLERLPARMVDPVLKEIEQMTAGVIG